MSCKTGCCETREAKAPGLRGTLAALPALAGALLAPAACPCCWATWGGIASAGSLGVLGQGRYVLPLSAGFMLLALALLAWQCRRRGSYLPLLAAVPGAALVLLSKTAPGLTALTICGGLLLIGASVWSAWPRSAARRPLAAPAVEPPASC